MPAMLLLRPLSRSPSASLRSFSTAARALAQPSSFRVVVVGAGSGGLAVAATLSEKLGKDTVAVVDPATTHYYQPLWTFVGAGLANFAESGRPLASLIPSNAIHFPLAATEFQPNKNQVTLSDGSRLTYEALVVAPGIQLDWGKVKGLPEALKTKDSNVVSIYSADYVQTAAEKIQNFGSGTAVFTQPSTPIKCAGAPQKIAYLAEENFRDRNVRDKSRVIFATGAGKIFGVDKYGAVLLDVVKKRNIELKLQTELAEVRPNTREAVFKVTSTDGVKEEVIKYDLLHAVPPMSAPDFIKKSPLAHPQSGWVDVDKNTLQHVRYPNVFSLGDASSVPTSRTAAAAAAESAVVKQNVIMQLAKKPMIGSYDGYCSCPLVTSKKTVVLAEFSGFDLKPMETLWFDQARESKFAYYLTHSVIPSFYWNAMVKGRWEGPAIYRKIFNKFRFSSS